MSEALEALERIARGLQLVNGTMLPSDETDLATIRAALSAGTGETPVAWEE